MWRLYWAGRLIVLFIVVGVWALPMPQFRLLSPDAPTRTVTLDPPQTVQTNDPRLCVHTRLTDEVEEWKIQETLRMVREMGAPTIVEFFPWAYVERDEGVYDWSHPDRIIKHIENQGLEVIARLGLVPPWVNEDSTDVIATLNLLPREDFDLFAEFVGAFAERYAGRVNYITVWNEPNLDFEWGNRPTDPEAYVELLRLSYEAAKAANPDMIVLNGALAPTNASPDANGGAWNDLDFWRRMYEAGVADYFDAVAFHNYPFAEPPQAEPSSDVLNFRRMELWLDIMADYDDGDKHIYITETGWNDHPRFRDAVSPAERINYTLDMYRYTAENYPNVQAVCIWKFRLPAPTNRYPDYFTLVTPEFEPKPIYNALQAYAHGTEDE
jgi:polysaccharide biosynthesis protein PslG